MAHAGLLLLAVVAVATGATYAYIARAVRRRPTQEPAARRATLLFSWWWDGLAALNLLTALMYAVGAFDGTPFAFAEFLSVLFTGLACFTFASLVYYLLFVATGKPRPLTWVFGYYAVAFVGGVYFVTSLEATGFTTTTWAMVPTYTRPPAMWASALDAIVVAGPIIVATARYALLYPLVDQATLRYRIALTAIAIAGWIALVITWPLSIGDSAGVAQVLARGIALLAAALTLLAYEPPSFIRRRLQVRALHDAQ